MSALRGSKLAVAVLGAYTSVRYVCHRRWLERKVVNHHFYAGSTAQTSRWYRTEHVPKIDANFCVPSSIGHTLNIVGNVSVYRFFRLQRKLVVACIPCSRRPVDLTGIPQKRVHLSTLLILTLRIRRFRVTGEETVHLRETRRLHQVLQIGVILAVPARYLNVYFVVVVFFYGIVFCSSKS
jgi:hypothetical protein